MILLHTTGVLKIARVTLPQTTQTDSVGAVSEVSPCSERGRPPEREDFMANRNFSASASVSGIGKNVVLAP